MQIKTTVRYLFLSTSITIIKKKKIITSVAETVEKLEPSHLADRNVT